MPLLMVHCGKFIQMKKVRGDMFKIIEKNAVWGELLYRGFVWEKGRCRSSGLWKYTYIKSLKKHINLLNEIAMCMQKEFAKEEDKGLKKDKRKICDLLFSLHNLPRVYLSKGASTLFELRGAGIGESDALQYSKSWMNEEMLRIYEDFL